MITSLSLLFRNACDRGNIHEIKVYLDFMADPNQLFDTNETPLYIASKNGYFDIVKFFVEKGVDINKSIKNGETPLFIASKYGHIHIVMYLFQNGAHIHKSTKSRLSPLAIACEYNNFEIAQFLITNGGHINLANYYGTSPFFLSCYHDNIEFQTYLITNGANINMMRKDGKIPLYLAIEYGNLDLLKLLVNHGVNIHQDMRYKGYSVIQVAIQRSYFHIIEYLYSKKVNLFVFHTDSTKTILQTACDYDCFDIVKFILDNNIDDNNFTISGPLALIYATSNGNVEIMKLLISKGISFQFPNLFRISNPKSFRYLVSIGYDFFGKELNRYKHFFIDKYWRSFNIVHSACYDGNLNVLKSLLDDNKLTSFIDLQDYYRWTPLHIAAYMNRIDVVELLIENGANTTLCNDKGHSALHFACSKGHVEIVKLIIGYKNYKKPKYCYY
jgi:ankyrin repeat protein